MLVQMPVHRLLIKTADGTRSPGAVTAGRFLRAGGRAHSFGSHPMVISLFQVFEEWQVEIEKEYLLVRAQTEPKGLKRASQHSPGGPGPVSCWAFLPQSIPGQARAPGIQPGTRPGCGSGCVPWWVQVGLGVVGRVPDRKVWR